MFLFCNETWKKNWDRKSTYFGISLTRLRQRHCDKKASIEITWEPSLIVTLQLLTAHVWMALQYVNICLFWNHSDGRICGFTSAKRQELHKWSVHRIHGARNVWLVLWKERQSPWFRRRYCIPNFNDGVVSNGTDGLGVVHSVFFSSE